jgi:hypothetical protein
LNLDRRHSDMIEATLLANLPRNRNRVECCGFRVDLLDPAPWSKDEKMMHVLRFALKLLYHTRGVDILRRCLSNVLERGAKIHLAG